MPEYLDDPSVLTKEKLKSELLAHNVELPSGNPTKDVYVQLYLKNLTAQNQKHAALDAFSSDEELPPAIVSGRSRSSGRKSTKKIEKVQQDDIDVTAFTDEGLRGELLKHGVDVGPIVVSTRKLYEKKLQKLLDDGPGELLPTDIQVNHNGSAEPSIYSDKEDEVTPEPESVTEPEPAPEPVPVVERPLRSRGKTPVTTRTRSSQHQKHDQVMDEEDHGDPVRRVKLRPRRFSYQTLTEELRFSEEPPETLLNTALLEVEKITASEQTPTMEEKDVLKELFPNDVTSQTGLSVSCRRPIRGAAGRPVVYSDLWNDENGLLSPKTTRTSSYSSTESHIVHRVSSQPPPSTSITPPSSAASRSLTAAPPADQTEPVRRGMSMWIKLSLLCLVAVFLFLVYQAMETNSIGPFAAQGPDAVGGSTA